MCDFSSVAMAFLNGDGKFHFIRDDNEKAIKSSSLTAVEELSVFCHLTHSTITHDVGVLSTGQSIRRADLVWKIVTFVFPVDSIYSTNILVQIITSWELDEIEFEGWR